MRTLPDRRVLVTAACPSVRLESIRGEAAQEMAAPDLVGPPSAPRQMTDSPRVRMEGWRAGGPQNDRELAGQGSAFSWKGQVTLALAM